MPEDKRREAQPDDLGEAAVIRPEDKAMAGRFWAHYGTPLFRALLAAIREKK